MPQNELRYSLEVLEETPPRATKLLSAIGAVSVIRTLLGQGGMKDSDISEGSALLLACWGQPPSLTPVTDTEDAQAQREAVAELDQWDEPNFARYSAALQRRFPSAAEYVFYKLAASTGVAAVAGVATFLTRIDALENGTDEQRADTKKEDKKAVELLASRGLDKKERARLQALVKVALSPTTPLAPDANAANVEREDTRIEALTALKDWYEEWAATARAVVKKRVYLIRMGLASRKSPKKAGARKGGSGDKGDKGDN